MPERTETSTSVATSGLTPSEVAVSDLRSSQDATPAASSKVDTATVAPPNSLSPDHNRKASESLPQEEQCSHNDFHCSVSSYEELILE